MSFSIPLFHQHYSKKDRLRVIKQSAEFLRFEDWMEPSEVIPYLWGDIEAIDEYLYFIRKDNLIPHLEHIQLENEIKLVKWFAENDWETLKKFDPDFYRVIKKHINENYDRELADYLDYHVDIEDVSTLKSLRKRGNHKLAENIILHEDYMFEGYALIYGGDLTIQSAINNNIDIDGVAANRLEIYNRYKDYIRAFNTYVLAVHGYPEVARDLQFEAQDQDIEGCLTRTWQQREMMEVLLDNYRGPTTIEINNLSNYNIELDTVKLLHDKGYELNVRGTDILDYPSIAKFMIENYRSVDISQSIRDYLEDGLQLDPPPDKMIEALEVISMV